VTPHAKEVPNESVHREEPLRMRGGFEPPHLSLALPGRLMRDFGSIAFVLPRACALQTASQCCESPSRCEACR
jgi:hypothetical protein